MSLCEVSAVCFSTDFTQRHIDVSSLLNLFQFENKAWLLPEYYRWRFHWSYQNNFDHHFEDWNTNESKVLSLESRYKCVICRFLLQNPTRQINFLRGTLRLFADYIWTLMLISEASLVWVFDFLNFQFIYSGCEARNP